MTYREFIEKYPDAPDGAYCAMIEYQQQAGSRRVGDAIRGIVMLAVIVGSVIATWPMLFP